MIKLLDIKQFTDILLLNACSVRSSGLHEGKAGIALCLFEIARCLDNPQIEDHAFELLQESLALANRNKSVDFENGLSGVGFVLLYLIENGFLATDFDELFGEQLDNIQSQIKNSTVFSEKDLSLVYFLELISHSQNLPEYSVLINDILRKTEESLEKQLTEFGVIHSGIVKSYVLAYFEYYLKVCQLCKNYILSASLTEKYVELYLQGKIVSRFETGYYLEQVAFNAQNTGLAAVAGTIKEYAAQNIHPASLTLAQRTGLLYLLNRDDRHYQKQINLLEKDLLDTFAPEYERKLIQAIPPDRLIAGYGSGIARLLLYWIHKENKRNHRDCSRFDYLF